MEFYVYAPQFIWFALCAIGLTVSILKHGEPLVSKYDAGSYFAVRWVALTGLLYWGGFFDGSAC